MARTLCAGAVHMTTIDAVALDGRSCTLHDAAVAGVSGVEWACGTDNTPGFNAWMTSARLLNGRVVREGRPDRWAPGPGRLSLEEREEISLGLHRGESFSVIAGQLGRAVSTVCVWACPPRRSSGE